MNKKDCFASKDSGSSMGWAFLVFGVAITVANVVAYLQFVGVIN